MLNDILNLVQRNDLMTSLDLQDAYYSVPVRQNCKHLLRFRWASRMYQFTCLPNGYVHAPRLFTKIMKVPLRWVRQQGHMVLMYLDDSWIRGPSLLSSKEATKCSAIELLRCGFMINWQKSSPWLKCKIDILGFCVDSEKMHLTLPKTKEREVLSLLEDTLQNNSCAVKHLAKICGKLVALFPVLPLGCTHF